jgi:hypothetical protein
LRIEDYPPRPESPYETRWPGERLPRYFERPFFLRQHSYPLRGCFVHVGKTAGSSVGCAVGFQLHCRKELRHPRGYLPRLTARLLHSDVNDCTAEEDYYLLSVRDPLERIQSWYVYEEKKLQELYANCSFPTLNDLAERGLETYKKHRERVREASGNASLPTGADSAAGSKSRRERDGSVGSRRAGYDDDDGDEAEANYTIRGGVDDDRDHDDGEADRNAASATVPPPRPLASVRCRFKARRVIRGTEKIGSHAYYNYARYMTQIPDGAAVGVIRTPHLVQDWNSMEAYLTDRVRDVERQAGRAADDNTRHAQPSSRNPLASLWTPRRPDPPPVQITRLGSKNRTPRRAAAVLPNETGASASATEELPSPSSSAEAATDGVQGDERRHLSPLARELLCEALCDEIQVYKRILRRAVNLGAADVRESLDELRRTCPREADLPGACLY